MIIDFHNDTILKIFNYNYPFYSGHDKLEVDFIKLQKSKVDAMFFAFCTSPVYSRNESKELLNKLLQCLNKEVIKDGKFFEIAKNHSELLQIVTSGKRAILLSIEGAYSVEEAQHIDELFNMGFRLITLTHTKSTPWAGSTSTTDGLGGNGKEIIKRMNQLGMIIDLAHTSKQTIIDVTKITKSPVVVSHCGVTACNDSKRALDDDSIQRVINTGGLIGVSFFPEHLRMSPPEGLTEYDQIAKKLAPILSDTSISSINKFKPYLDVGYFECKTPKDLPGVEAVFNTIDYIAEKFGDQFVAIGSDFDGIPYCCKDFDNISKLQNLSKLMQSKGYSTQSIDKIFGKNIEKIISQLLR